MILPPTGLPSIFSAIRKIPVVGWIFVCGFYLFSSNYLSGIETSARQLAIEATFTIGIADYVTWKSPRLRENPKFEILVLGDASFADALTKVSKLKAGSGRTPEVKLIERTDQLECAHMLYVGDVSKEDFEQVLSYCRSEGMLLISNRKDFVDRGGLIQFIQLNNRLRFIINRDRLNDFQIRISSKLMKLAYEEGANG